MTSVTHINRNNSNTSEYQKLVVILLKFKHISKPDVRNAKEEMLSKLFASVGVYSSVNNVLGTDLKINWTVITRNMKNFIGFM